MPIKSKPKSRSPSGSTEIPFSLDVFSTSGSRPMPIGPPDTSSLTAMPELGPVMTTDDDWKSNPKWKTLIGTPSKPPVPPNVLVPDLSPALTFSDSETETETTSSPSATGSFIHQRRQGEYVKRPPVWRLSDTGTDIMDCPEEIDSPYHYEKNYDPVKDIKWPLEQPVKRSNERHNVNLQSPTWSNFNVPGTSYDNQVSSMAATFTEEPLVVNIVHVPSNGALDPAATGGSEASLAHLNGNGTQEASRDENDGVTNTNANEPDPDGGHQTGSQTAQAPSAQSTDRGDSNASQATMIGDSRMDPRPGVPHMGPIELPEDAGALESYLDLRSPGNGIGGLNQRISVGSRVRCVDATIEPNSEGANTRHIEGFKSERGDSYIVAKMYGDRWALCVKLNTEHRLVENLNRSLRRKLGLQRSKDVIHVRYDPQVIKFLPLCDVVLTQNYRAYKNNCQYPRTRLVNSPIGVTMEPGRDIDKGLIVQAAPRGTLSKKEHTDATLLKYIMIPRLVFDQYQDDQSSSPGDSVDDPSNNNKSASDNKDTENKKPSVELKRKVWWKRTSVKNVKVPAQANDGVAKNLIAKTDSKEKAGTIRLRVKDSMKSLGRAAKSPFQSSKRDESGRTSAGNSSANQHDGESDSPAGNDGEQTPSPGRLREFLEAVTPPDKRHLLDPTSGEAATNLKL